MSRMRGQTSLEYLLVAVLVGIAIALGSPSPLARLIDAVSERHARFAYGMSMP